MRNEFAVCHFLNDSRRGVSRKKHGRRDLPCYGQAFFLIPNKVSLTPVLGGLFLNKVALRA